MSSRQLLLSLLSENIHSCHHREATEFDRALAGKCHLVLFGAGGLGRKVLAALRSEGIEPLAFADNKLAGACVEGLQVVSPAQAADKWKTSAAFVVTIWASWAGPMQDQMQSLRLLGCETVVSFIPLLWKFPRLLPHVQIDLPSRVLEQADRVLAAFDSLTGAASQDEYIAQLRWRLFGDFDSLPSPLPDQYWPADLITLNSDSCFIDAGAFDGDTFAQFAAFTHGQFRRAYLLEPDPSNCAAIQARLLTFPQSVQDRVRVLPYAVADSDYELPFSPGLGASSAVGSGQSTVQCKALDHVIADKPGYIKYDVEGFELRALSGTRRIIQQHAPALAVCAYHIQNHLWEIPLLIQSLSPAYNLYLRPHGQIWETIYYAIPGGS